MGILPKPLTRRRIPSPQRRRIVPHDLQSSAEPGGQERSVAGRPARRFPNGASRFCVEGDERGVGRAGVHDEFAVDEEGRRAITPRQLSQGFELGLEIDRPDGIADPGVSRTALVRRRRPRYTRSPSMSGVARGEFPKSRCPTQGTRSIQRSAPLLGSEGWPSVGLIAQFAIGNDHLIARRGHSAKSADAQRPPPDDGGFGCELRRKPGHLPVGATHRADPVQATAGGDCAGGSCPEPTPAATIRSRTPESDAAAAIANFF